MDFIHLLNCVRLKFSILLAIYANPPVDLVHDRTVRAQFDIN